MSTVEQTPVYDELIDLLARNAKADDVLTFHLSDEKQQRLDDLLSKN